MKQVSGARYFMNVVQGAVVSNIPCSAAHSQVSHWSSLLFTWQGWWGAKGIQGHIGPKEPEVPSGPVNSRQQVLLTVNEWYRGCKLETPPPANNYTLCVVCLRLYHTHRLLAASIQAVGSQKSSDRLHALSDACNKSQSFLGPMMHLGPLMDPQFAKVMNQPPQRKNADKCNCIGDSFVGNSFADFWVCINNTGV